MIMCIEQGSITAASADVRTHQAVEEREALQDYQAAFERHRDAMIRLAQRFSATRPRAASATALVAAEAARRELGATLARLDRVLRELRAGLR